MHTLQHKFQPGETAFFLFGNKVHEKWVRAVFIRLNEDDAMQENIVVSHDGDLPKSETTIPAKSAFHTKAELLASL